MNWIRIALPLLGLSCLTLPTHAVRYRVTFDATWSEETHGENYTGINNPHFSTPIGTTHNEMVDFWEPGSLASSGLETLAETGSLRLIIPEIQAAIDDGNAFGFVQGATFQVPATQERVFEAIPEFPNFTYVSMIAPSPDWFVGADSVPLRDANGWLPEVTVDLIAYDAGTEEGEIFFTGNPATTPHEPIRRLDTDSSATLFQSAPFGQLQIELLPICDINGDGNCDTDDLNSTDGLYSAGNLVEGVTVILGENSHLDLNSDGTIDTLDIDFFLADAAERDGFAEPYLKGDSNLNDHVGFGDFLDLSRGFGMGREWTDGNFDGDNQVGFVDFLNLSRNFGKAIARQNGVAAVPEPSPRLLTWLALLGVMVMRGRFGTARS